jgi:hypothetical protein
LRALDAPADLVATVESFAMASRAEPWLLRTKLLRDFGYLPGDIVMLDRGILRPFPNDLVQIELIDRVHRTSISLFRCYRPPYFVASLNDDDEALPIDERLADVRGVVIATFRARRGR